METSQRPHGTWFNLGAEEKRRLVHLLAALREHIADEVTFLAEDPADPRSTPLSKFDEVRFCAYVWQELTDLMVYNHYDEACRIDQARRNPWLEELYAMMHELGTPQ